MNTKTTLTVTVIAITLGILFLIFETDLFNRKLPTASEQGSAAGTPGATGGKAIPGFEKLKAEDVKRVRIERAGEPAVVIERQDHGWTQVEPVKFPLQPFDLDRMVSDAIALRSTGSFTPAEKGLTLEQLGLATPRVVMTLEPGDGKPITLSLGKQGAAGVAYVALDKPSDKSVVYAVGTALHGSLVGKEPREWRSRTLASFTPGSIQHVSLTREGEKLELTQKDGKWVIDQPFTGRADSGAAQGLAAVPTSAGVRDFVQDKPGDLNPFGLKDPKIVLVLEVSDLVTDKDKPKDQPKPEEKKAGDKPVEPQPPKPETKTTMHKLAVGNPQTLSGETYFAMWDDAPVIFTLGKADVEKLRKAAKDLRDPRLTPIGKGDLREIKVEQPKAETVNLVREAGAWKFGQPAPAFRLASEQVEQIVGAMTDTKASDYVPADPAKLGQAVATLTLMVNGSDQQEKLNLYQGEKDKLISVRGNETTGYVVDKAALGPVFEPLLAYRDRTVLDIQKEGLIEVHLKRGGEYPAEYRITRAAPSEGQKGLGDWKLDGFDRQAVQALIDRVAPLMAEKWLAEPPAKPPEGVQIELTTKDGAKHKVLLDAQSRVGLVEGVKDAFVVRNDIAQAAAGELRDRNPLKLDSAQIAVVKLGPAVIVRDPQGKYKIDGDPKLNEQKAAAIFDGLGGLSVEHYLPIALLQKIGEPVHTLVIQTRDDKTHKLALWPAAETNGQRWIGRAEDSQDLFVLHKATGERLIGAGAVAPVSVEEPEK